MHISDLVSQYQNPTPQTEIKGSKGVHKLVSTLKDMGTGNVFEGTVNSAKGGKVVLGLPNGQEITARLDGKVKLTVGQSMFFQVKSNDGNVLAIRPYTVGGNSMNLTLMEALKAAGLPMDDRNLAMVNSMMQEQMSIDRNSLAQMSRVISANSGIDVNTLVQMQKLDLPITPEMASQFQNYLEDKQAIGKELMSFMQELPGAMADENMTSAQMLAAGKEILSVITEGLSSEIPMTVQSFEAFVGADGTLAGDMSAILDAANVEAGVVDPNAELMAGENGEIAGEVGAEADVAGAEVGSEADVAGAETGKNTTVQYSNQALGGMLTEEEYTQLSTTLKQFDGMDLDENLFSNGALRKDIGSVTVLKSLEQMIGKMDFHALDPKQTELFKEFLSGKAFPKLLEDSLKQQWSLKPEEITKENAIQKLYEHLDDQMSRIENAIHQSGSTNESVSQMAADIRSNVEFMNVINENYSYVQIPLQMSGQNANGELYVYTNKKSLKEGTKDLTAFLHLDMDNLGSTDVSVKMHERDVSTNFYFDNDQAYELVSANAPILEARLKAKGYNCKVQVTNDSKKVNFVDDFLKKDAPSAGRVHRYSFDMRA